MYNSIFTEDDIKKLKRNKSINNNKRETLNYTNKKF